MPSKRDCVEDLLGQLEERFYQVLANRESFDNYFGGKVRISFSTRKPKLNISIAEQRKPGPRLGRKFKIDASRRAARRLAKLGHDEEGEFNE